MLATLRWLHMAAGGSMAIVGWDRGEGDAHAVVARVEARRLWAPPVHAEWLVALILAGVVALSLVHGWRLYEVMLAPAAQTVTPPSLAPPGVRADDRAARERYQAVMNGLGEAAAYRAASRQDWADATLKRVLELDPTNPAALQLKSLWALEPPPALSEAERAAREREARLVDLLGAASAHLTAGQMEAARWFANEALALDPSNANAQALLDATK